MDKIFVYIKGKTLFLTFLIAFLLVSTATAGMVAASPETTYFYVDPPEVKDVMPEDIFLITINVTGASDTYAWGLYLSWDPDLLELVTVTEGDFLHRWEWDEWAGEWVPQYDTTLLFYPSLAEANLEGEIKVGCSLFLDVPWASGDGWLCSLEFRVEALGSCVLNLFDTCLSDHILAGSPAPTYYPNLDGFFFNTLFHDIAITNVAASLTDAGELVAINVTVTNEGNYTETSETFNVTVYADIEPYEYEYDIREEVIKNMTAVGDEVIVGTETVTESLAPGANTTLTFTWNTTGVAGDDYTISAEAMGDDDTRNNLFIDGTVTVAVHDIAITSVVPSLTEVTVGENVTIEVTVKNEGHFNETFNVTVYADLDTAVIGDEITVGTETGITLDVGDPPTTLIFTWETTDVAEGTYTISAEAVVAVDDDPDDNVRSIEVKVRGAPAPDILLYAAVGIVIIIVAAIAIYIIKIRK